MTYLLLLLPEALPQRQSAAEKEDQPLQRRPISPSLLVLCLSSSSPLSPIRPSVRDSHVLFDDHLAPIRSVWSLCGCHASLSNYSGRRFDLRLPTQLDLSQLLSGSCVGLARCTRCRMFPDTAALPSPPDFAPWDNTNPRSEPHGGVYSGSRQNGGTGSYQNSSRASPIGSRRPRFPNIKDLQDQAAALDVSETSSVSPSTPRYIYPAPTTLLFNAN